MADTPLLISSRAAASYLGIDPKTFVAVAETEGLTAVSSGRRRFWQLPQVKRLAGLPAERENA